MHPTQIIRYARNTEPLWLSKENIPICDSIPSCEYCGSSRQFEFQVLYSYLIH